MIKANSPLINASEVLRQMQTKDSVIVDARSGTDSYERFMSGHLENALHVDLDRDLSQKPLDPAIAGRHPLPDIKNFARLLGTIGITPHTSVIVYDDKSGANAAARFWWMLCAFGHKNVQVVDGGLDALKKKNVPLLSTLSFSTIKAPYPAQEWKLPTVDIDQVAQAVSMPNALVIDVRESYRFRGEREPIDLVAGHIPGAKNIPYINNLDAEGNFLPAETLKALYKNEIGNREIYNVIVHCGSGVTACHTLLSLGHAGMPGAKLYIGSWSQWSRSGRQIATTF